VIAWTTIVHRTMVETRKLVDKEASGVLLMNPWLPFAPTE
jgi:hypothetical protein